jgi:hypothetical protein
VTSTSAVTLVDVSTAGIPAVTFARVESPRVCCEDGPLDPVSRKKRSPPMNERADFPNTLFER